MSLNFHGDSAAWLFHDSSPSGDESWHELHRLAERAGVSVEHLCATVETATHFTQMGKATSSPSSNDDLEEVIRALADDNYGFDSEFETKSEWHEADHPRDEDGRFSSGGARRSGAPSPPIAGNPALPWFNHAHEVQELKRVHSVLEQLYPDLVSRWKGELEIYPQAEMNASGKKSWECQILLAQELMNQPVRKLCTQIHEGFHALSPTTDEEYNRAPKWEEGAIEGALRNLRTEVARSLGIGISQSMFDARDRYHPYNRYVDALESIRNALYIGDSRGFYDQLMRTPADKMEDYILSQVPFLTESQQKKFPRRFAIAKAILEDKFKP